MIKATYLACDYDERFPIISADSFLNLRLALDDYCGADERKQATCKGFFPYDSKYPSDYEGYFEYECCKGNENPEDTYIDKFRVYCVEFYPLTKTN